MTENQAIEQRRNLLLKMRTRHHRNCPVCSELNPHGLKLVFRATARGVEAETVLGEEKEGYCGHLHGGTVASMLDGAMTNCLFSYGVRAVTGELLVRLLHPLQADKMTIVRAQIERHLARLYVLSAEVLQESRVAAKGKAKFVRTKESEVPD